MDFSTAYNIIDTLIAIIYGLTIAFITIRALDFIELKTRMEDYNEPLGYHEIATPPPISTPLIEAIANASYSPTETVKTSNSGLGVSPSKGSCAVLASQPSPTASYSSLHISKLRVLASVPSNSRLTKKELLAILND